jgi:glutathione-independent formaldehyde dehydrogenase
MMASPNDRLSITKIVNAKAISLEDAPKGYAEFDKGIAAKFVPDPHDHWRRRTDSPRPLSRLH